MPLTLFASEPMGQRLREQSWLRPPQPTRSPSPLVLRYALYYTLYHAILAITMGM